MLYQAEKQENKMLALWKKYQSQHWSGPVGRARPQPLLFAKEQYDEAIDQLEILEGFEKDNLSVKIQIAFILIEQSASSKRPPPSWKIFEQAPELDKVRYYLALVYEELGRGPDAIAEYNKIFLARAVISSTG